MLLFFRRKARADGFTAVAVNAEGVATATIRRAASAQPQLVDVAWRALDGTPAATLADLVERRHLRGAPCTTLMASGEYQLLLVEAPDVEAGELRSAIRWRIKDLIDFHIDDAVIDVFEIPGQGRGRARMMYAVAARTATVKQRIAQLEEANLDLQCIDIEELALRNLAARLPEDARGIALLWLRGDHGQILITRGGELFLARRIEMGTTGLFSVAQQGGDSTQGEYGPELVNALEHIVLELQRSLDYYDSHFSQPPVQTVYVAPMAPDLPFVADYLQQHLPLQVAAMDLQQMFPDAQLPSDDSVAHCLTAIGAALRVEEMKL